MDRAESFNTQGGPLGAEVMSSLYKANNSSKAINYVYGLGGRDVTVDDMRKVFETLEEIDKSDEDFETYRFMGVRE